MNEYDTNNSVIAKKLRSLRGEKSRDEVCKAIGVSASALAMYEAGARVPRDEIKVRIAEYYKQTIEFIFFTK